jgi:uncharacterized protein (TIGR02246 family)
MSTSTTTQDEAAIKSVMQAFMEAWNTHDAGVYAGLFTEDADFVNVMGLWMKGRSEIEQGHRQVFSTFLSDSYLRIIETTVRFLKPDVAVLHSTWEITGQRSPDGEHSLRDTGVLTAVTIRHNTDWQITTLQNTGLVPLAAPFHH